MAYHEDASVDPKWKRFVKVMREIFELDKRELDFGIYRVMNLKRKEIEGYLDGTLQKEAEDILAKQAGGKRASLEAERDKLVASLASAGVSLESSSKLKEIDAALATLTDMHTLTERLWGHLAEFFSRYWDDGDFATTRRYDKEAYAIPYAGQETLLWWASADQYYIKTAEVFTDWAFRTADGKSVRFVLREPEGDEALTEQNNDKPQGKSRLFALQDAAAIEVAGDVMTVPFVYRLFDKEVKQAALVKAATEAIKEAVEDRYIDFVGLLERCPVESNPDRTLAQKQLEAYTARNTADYFIHKNLGGFLKRELDWYVKNDVLFIEDIDAQTKMTIEDSLALSNAFKAVGLKIIEFLSELEDFQKRLWLKRKFVVSCSWCVTLDRVPHELYGQVASNERQRQEWVRLFAIDKIAGDLTRTGYSEPLSVAFLEENPHLIVDTGLFGEDFKRRLLASMEDIDGGTGGTLVKSDNFHALMLLGERYAGAVKCIYIDPPYNTGGDGFVYKDSYQHSTWLTMMENRIRLARELLADDGAIFISIDDNEQARLKTLCDAIFGEENFVGNFIWKKKGGSGNTEKILGCLTEYIVCYAKKKAAGIFNYQKIDREYKYKDDQGDYNLEGLEKTNLGQYERRTMQFAMTDPKTGQSFFPKANMRWTIGKETFDQYLAGGKIYFDYENMSVKRIKRQEDYESSENVYVNLLEDFGSLGRAKDELNGFFNAREIFETPKPTQLVKHFLQIATSPDSLVLDFFGGSGTTAHAVINLNREDGGQRKWVVVEAAPYFEAVTKTRIMKAMYSDFWSGGVPSRTGGVSGCFKVLTLEQYEDTLDNLSFDGGKPFELKNEGDTSYTTRHMMDVQTRRALSYDAMLDHPFAASMKVRQGSERRVSAVDVVETFNYLLGLCVKKVSFPQENLELVEGEAKGQLVLVVWRDVDKVGEGELRSYFKDTYGAAQLKGFDQIYVNGDCTLAGLLGRGGGNKVHLTQQAFVQLMFD